MNLRMPDALAQDASFCSEIDHLFVTVTTKKKRDTFVAMSSQQGAGNTGASSVSHRGVDLGPIRGPLLRQIQPDPIGMLSVHPLLPLSPARSRLAATSVPADVVR